MTDHSPTQVSDEELLDLAHTTGATGRPMPLPEGTPLSAARPQPHLHLVPTPRTEA